MTISITEREIASGLETYAGTILKEGYLPKGTEALQCQTSGAREKVDYVVHHGAWDRTGEHRVFHQGATIYEDEDEACAHAAARVASLSMRFADASEPERRDLAAMISSIWIERRTTTTQTIGFMDLPVRTR